MEDHRLLNKESVMNLVDFFLRTTNKVAAMEYQKLHKIGLETSRVNSYQRIQPRMRTNLHPVVIKAKRKTIVMKANVVLKMRPL